MMLGFCCSSASDVGEIDTHVHHQHSCRGGRDSGGLESEARREEMR
jgi:hypothetical protein